MIVGAGEATEGSRLARAVAGDEAALQCLLMEHHDALVAHIGARLPEDLQAFLSVEDVLQDAYLTVFRKIREFEPHGTGGFHAWLVTIAERRLSDLIEAQHCAKRGGGRIAAQTPAEQEHSAVIGLLDLVAAHSRTPSRSAAEHEAVAAVQAALKDLPEDQRRALELRYLEGLSVAAAAERMGRSDGAVYMLCNRGLASLREQLGDLSRFLTRLP